MKIQVVAPKFLPISITLEDEQEVKFLKFLALLDLADKLTAQCKWRSIDMVELEKFRDKLADLLQRFTKL